MDELREKIAAEILGEFGGEHRAGERAREAADCILGIPRIAEALRATEDGGELDVYRANCEYPD